MPGFTAAAEATMLNAILTGTYVALFIGDPDAAGVEVAGGAYARQAFVYTVTGGNPSTAANTGTITFPTATANWGAVSHFALYSALTVGTKLHSKSLSSVKTIEIDDTIRWLAGKLKIILGDLGEV